MDVIKQNIANSGIDYTNESMNMLNTVNVDLKQRRSNFQNRLNNIRNVLKVNIKNYEQIIENLRNSIIYIEVEDENGNKHIESPNQDEMYSKIRVYNAKLQKLYSIYSEYESVYKDYYNNIERNINIVSKKIRDANEYLSKLKIAQKDYLSVALKKSENTNLDQANNVVNLSSKNSESQLSKFEMCQKLIDEYNSESAKNNYDFAMSQLMSFEKVGGSYNELKKLVQEKGLGYIFEVHHVPPRSSAQITRTRISKKDGSSEVEEDISPAVIIIKTDHEKTASYRKSEKSIKFQNMQRELVSKGKYLEAFQNEKNDLNKNFGNRYNKQIKQVEGYINKLISEGTIKVEE